MKKIKTIEQVAKILLDNRIPFNYRLDNLFVKDQDISNTIFWNVSYHIDSKLIIFMDSNYNGVDKRVIEEWAFNLKK